MLSLVVALSFSTVVPHNVNTVNTLFMLFEVAYKLSLVDAIIHSTVMPHNADIVLHLFVSFEVT